jgi:hypothetical protein
MKWMGKKLKAVMLMKIIIMKYFYENFMHKKFPAVLHNNIIFVIKIHCASDCTRNIVHFNEFHSAIGMHGEFLWVWLRTFFHKFISVIV